MRLDELPDDLLVLIFQHCRIDDILALRLANKRSKDTIADYARPILSSAAHETIPVIEYERLYQQAEGDYSLRWLKRLIPRYLAVVLLEGPSFRGFKAIGWSSIASWDPLGDELRGRLENGWRILKKLSNISRAVYSPPMVRMANAFNQDTWSHIQSSLRGRLALGAGTAAQDFAFISQKEQMIDKRRHDYVDSMSQADAADYMLLTRLLSKSLRHHPRFKADGSSVMSVVNMQLFSKSHPPAFDWAGKLPGVRYWFEDWQIDSPCPMAPWLLWFILHAGPDPFFRQWTSRYDDDRPKADCVAELAWSLWDRQDARTINRRAQLAGKLDIAIRRKCLRPRKEKLDRGPGADLLLNEAIQRGTSDHKLFLREAQLAEYFMQWRAMGGNHIQVDLSEDEQIVEDGMIAAGRHPREKGPFFVYLGREREGREQRREQSGRR